MVIQTPTNKNDAPSSAKALARHVACFAPRLPRPTTPNPKAPKTLNPKKHPQKNTKSKATKPQSQKPQNDQAFNCGIHWPQTQTKLSTVEFTCPKPKPSFQLWNSLAPNPNQAFNCGIHWPKIKTKAPKAPRPQTQTSKHPPARPVHLPTRSPAPSATSSHPTHWAEP